MNIELSPWQHDFIFGEDEGFNQDLKIACCGVGSGKSYALSIWLVLQCLKKPGIRGIIIAQNYNALSKVLARNIVMFASSIGVIVSNKANKELTFPNGSVLFGYSAENPESLLGLSEIALLAIDEAAYCPEDIYNFAKDRMRGSNYNSMTRLISSPNSTTKVQNWFSNIVRKFPNKVIHASSLDNKFVSESYKEELKERYQEGTNLYKQQVLGEIVDGDVASQIVFRNDFTTMLQGNSNDYYLGYDASGLGADKDVIIVINKYGIVEVKEFIEADTFTKAGAISDLYDKYKIKSGCADATGGYSLGVLDTLKAKNIDIYGINFAQKPYTENYPNARTEMYMDLATVIKNGFYVEDLHIREEILAQQVTINNRGQQALVPKELIKKNIGYSPDHSDALALAVYAMKHNNVNIYDSKKACEISTRYLNFLTRN